MEDVFVGKSRLSSESINMLLVMTICEALPHETLLRMCAVPSGPARSSRAPSAAWDSSTTPGFPISALQQNTLPFTLDLASLGRDPRVPTQQVHQPARGATHTADGRFKQQECASHILEAGSLRSPRGRASPSGGLSWVCRRPSPPCVLTWLSLHACPRHLLHL